MPVYVCTGLGKNARAHLKVFLTLNVGKPNLVLLIQVRRNTLLVGYIMQHNFRKWRVTPVCLMYSPVKRRHIIVIALQRMMNGENYNSLSHSIKTPRLFEVLTYSH